MVMAVAAVLLAAASIGLGVVNQADQEAFARRQEYAGQTPQVARVVQLVAQTLAEAAQRSNDETVRDLLTRTGFTIRVAPSQTPTPPSAPAPVFSSVATPAPAPALPLAPVPAANSGVPTAAARPAMNTSLSPDPPSSAMLPAGPAVVTVPATRSSR